jgi:hypothetical protein
MRKAEGDLGDVGKDKRHTTHSAHHGREEQSDGQRKMRREKGQNFLKDKRVARRIVEELMSRKTIS